jgi:hypothetical protein
VDPYLGVKKVGKDMNMVSVWSGLHSRAGTPYVSENVFANSPERDLVDGTDFFALQQLQGVAAGDWWNFCSAVGWTAYGAVALSWCSDAQPSQVWTAWLASGCPLKPLPEYERPVRMINPALFPPTRSLREIIHWVASQNPADPEVRHFAVSACLVALREPLVFDLEPADYLEAPAQIAAFLKSRLLARRDRTATEQAAIGACSQRVTGTTWDVWQNQNA